MSNISILSRMIGSAQRNVDLSANTLVVNVIKVGGSGGTDLTKAILDKLILFEGAADVDGTFDTRYTKIADLASLVVSKGASLVGLKDTGGYFATKNVEAALQALGSISGTAAASSVTYSNTTSLLTATNVQTAVDELDGRLDTAQSNIATNTSNISNEITNRTNADALLIPLSQKGANNGVATLTSLGKLTAGQVPAIAITDTYVVASQSAMLALTLVETGDVAVRTDLNKSFILSGTLYSNLAHWQELLTPTDQVQSVNGLTGTVVLTTSEITEGLNLYFTAARAKAAAVSNTITSGITDVAPSQDSVFTALATKAVLDLSNLAALTYVSSTLSPQTGNSQALGMPARPWSITHTNNVNTNVITALNNTSISVQSNVAFAAGAVLGMGYAKITLLAAGTVSTDAVNKGQLDASNSSVLAAGDSFAASTLAAVRYSKAADVGFIAGRVNKASNDATTVDNFYVIGLVFPSTAISPTVSLTVVKAGIINATAHGLTIGMPVYLSTAGAVTSTAPTAANSAIVLVGIALDADNVEVKFQVMGVN